MSASTPHMRTWRSLALLTAALVTATVATVATAASFPAQHFELTPVAGEPLRSGFAEIIHPNGPQVYARHVYQLNGASPDTVYPVRVSIWTSSLECEGAPTFVLPVAEVLTNLEGNGRADVTHPPELLEALGLRNVTIGGEVTLLRNSSVAYTTGCEVVELD